MCVSATGNVVLRSACTARCTYTLYLRWEETPSSLYTHTTNSKLNFYLKNLTKPRIRQHKGNLDNQ